MAEKEYIERDEAKRVMKANDWLNPAIPNVVNVILDRLPAADVVEVKHGKWVDKPTGSYCRMQSWCSACGKHSGIGGIESNRHKPYCPNCGAKMDGGAK